MGLSIQTPFTVQTTSLHFLQTNLVTVDGTYLDVYFYFAESDTENCTRQCVWHERTDGDSLPGACTIRVVWKTFGDISVQGKIMPWYKDMSPVFVARICHEIICRSRDIVWRNGTRWQARRHFRRHVNVNSQFGCCSYEMTTKMMLSIVVSQP